MRISPNEVSVNDINCNPTIYSQTTPWLKVPYHYTAFKSTTAFSIFTELDPDVHSTHLKLLSPSFSYAYVHERESQIYAKSSQMMAGIASRVQRKEQVELMSVIRSLALDIVTEYTYGKATGALKTFETDLFEIFDKAVQSVIYVGRSFATMCPSSLKHIVSTLSSSKATYSIYRPCFSTSRAEQTHRPGALVKIYYLLRTY